MREGKKSEGGGFKAPPPPDRIGLTLTPQNLSIEICIKKLFLFVFTLKLL